MNHITVKLTAALPTPSGPMSTVTLKAAKAGHLARARAAITRHPAFGKEMTDDGLTLLLFTLPAMLVSHDGGGEAPPNWPMELSQKDVTHLGEAMNALDAGYGDVEAFKAERARANAQALDAAEQGGGGVTPGFQAAPLPTPAPEGHAGQY